MLKELIDQKTLLIVLEEVEQEIRVNGVNLKEKAQLFHELGSIHGVLGNTSEQQFAWQQALDLDPDNSIIRQSLQDLKI
ncbi:hypothetical protein ACFL2U_00485 [Patescibacteria group bacterium]